MEDINKIKLMCFDTDDDFYKFCVVPELIVKSSTLPSGQTSTYVDFDLSPEYYDALANDVKFIIRDINSNIIKRNNTVNFKTCSKHVDNLYHWRYEKYFKKACPNYETYPEQPIFDEEDDNENIQ